MTRIARLKSLLTIFMAILLAAGILSGCRPKQTTQTTGTAGQTSTALQTSQTTQELTTASTVPSETTTAAATGSETTVASETETEPPETTVLPSVEYRVLPANQPNQVDLNDDGQTETITYSCLDDFSFNLTVNDITLRREGEMFLTKWFFLVDLDSGDNYLDVAIQELGASNDYKVTFFYFDGHELVLRGVIPGMICDVYSDNIDKEPFGLGTIRLDGQGGLIALARGNVLHTWLYDEPWQIGANLLLYRVPQTYYPMQSYDPVTGDHLMETAVKMKIDLPLTAMPNSSEVIAIARSGQSASLVQTDNKEWIQLRTEAGVLGWFQVQDFYMVMIEGKPYFSDDVFAGLQMAD